MAQFPKKQVLIIDATPMFREFLTEKLTEEKIEVETAQGHRDAVIKIANDLPDLIILDIETSIDDMQEFLDITPGAVSVLGLINDHEKRVQLLVDRQVMEDDYIGCHPCTNTTSLRIREQDMWDVVIPAMQHEPIFVDLA